MVENVTLLVLLGLGVGGRLEDQNGENPKRNYSLYFQHSMHNCAITQA